VGIAEDGMVRTSDRARMLPESAWVNWLGQFGNRLTTVLDGTTPIEDKKKFIEGIVDRIEVSFLDKQTASLEITLNYPYVGDKLVYIDPKNRRKGYKIRDGIRDLGIRFPVSTGHTGKKKVPL
jgi:hypothetical protein